MVSIYQEQPHLVSARRSLDLEEAYTKEGKAQRKISECVWFSQMAGAAALSQVFGCLLGHEHLGVHCRWFVTNNKIQTLEHYSLIHKLDQIHD